MIDGYIAARRADGRPPQTINRELAMFRAMCNHATERGLIDRSPMQGVRLLKEHSARLRFLSLDEWHMVIEAADVTLKPLILVALHTGLRHLELRGLRWQDIDFSTGLLHVVRGKGGTSRNVPLNVTVTTVLKQMPRRLDGYVFPRTDPSVRFRALCQRLGLTDVTLHTLRHTFASHLVMQGVDLVTVQQLLGHSTVQMTMRYSHLSPDHKRAAITRLDTYMVTENTRRHDVSV
jgi:integrase